MNETTDHLGMLHSLERDDILLVASVILLTWLVTSVVRGSLRRVAEFGPQRWRLPILRLIPLLRLFISIGALIVIVRIFVEPTLQNIVAIVASAGLALVFVLKDYASNLVAGVVIIIEGPYQPGDWVKMDGVYGEVKLIGVRATHIVTADDDEVIIPNSRLWSASVTNATCGSHSLLCTADFYLHPDHEGDTVRGKLATVAETSAYRKPETKVNVVVQEKPWGTHYKVKAYVYESREQFNFVTDLTIRGKQTLREMNLRFAQPPNVALAED